MLRLATVLLLVCLGGLASPAFAQSGANVLVVANESVERSVEIAERYAAARGIPPEQILRLNAGSSEVISRAAYELTISMPVSQWLTGHSAQDRILYIVLTRGVPLRIGGTIGRQGTSASVDSELTLLYRRMTGVTVAPDGPVPNPYFLGDRQPDAAVAFRRRDHDIYLVTRLDGFSVEDALALIDRGKAGASRGRIILDDVPLLKDPRSQWLETASTRLSAAGFDGQVTYDTTSRALTHEADVLGYYSWGSNDPELAVRQPDLTFAPGALAAMFLSTDARTFSAPPETWKPGGRTRTDVHGGSNQSLIGDLIRAGVTGVAGQVSEPLISGAVRPDILFPAYVMGSNLAEAFYLAIPNLSWQTVVVGDPLAAPFRKSSMTSDENETALDPTTELPPFFSARRLMSLKNAKLYGTSDAAHRLMARAESRSGRDNKKGAIEALREALKLEPEALNAWRMLGTLLEAASDYQGAADAYRQVIALDRDDAVTLNNLAYHLAVREKDPQEAIGYARRALTLGRGNPQIHDTFGWIQHLLGNDKEALPYVVRASRALPKTAEVQLHAAIVFAAVGQLKDAAKALDLAQSLDPSLAKREDVMALRSKIGR